MDDFWNVLDSGSAMGRPNDILTEARSHPPLPVIDRHPAGLRPVRTGREATRGRLEMDQRAAKRPAIGHSNVRDPSLDGLLTAEDRDGHDVEVAETVVQAREFAQAHLRRCASAGYWHAERRAARCATMAVRQGDGALDNPRESVLADLLRRRSRFVEVPVVEVDGSFDAVDAPQSGATMVTSVGEEMHRKLAMQSRDDAKAYLEMLNEEGVLMPPTSAATAALPRRPRELHAGGMVQDPGVMHSLRFAAPLGAGLHS